jgi:hypothetical protein
LFDAAGPAVKKNPFQILTNEVNARNDAITIYSLLSWLLEIAIAFH